jgi:1,4-alpha-glucan branching enzyme
MGTEIGTFRAWSQSNPIEWFLTDHTMHASLQLYCADLNHFYLEQPALWEQDGDRRSFSWIDSSNAEESICSFCRTAKNGDQLIAVLNLTPVEREGFLLSVPDEGIYEEIFNSDASKYGGSGNRNAGVFLPHPAAHAPFPQAIRITLPPLAALVFKRVK